MVHFPESVIITTIEGIQFKSFSNEHPPGYIIAKPKYIPVDEIFCSKLPCRDIFNKQLHRLNMWIDQRELKYYLQAFKEYYPQYLLKKDQHGDWLFAVPKEKVRQIFDPREGLKTLRNIPEKEKDIHLKDVLEFVDFIVEGGVSLDNLGITFSTLVGHYDPNYSDINLVIYGKENGWKIIDFLEGAKHPNLRWKTEKDWEKFRRKRNRRKIFTKEEFFDQMSRKRTEGFFNNTLFLLFVVEEENETWNKWGEEKYEPLDLVEVEGTVVDNYNSLIRPGYYQVKNSKTLNGKKVPIKQVVFYSRDYVMQAVPGEKIKACGLLEKVTNLKTKKQHYRVVIGYFDSYLNGRRDKEYIKKVN